MHYLTAFLPYLVALQLFCGCFSAFVAGQKDRNRIAWWFIGALLPVLGVALSLSVRPAPAESAGPASRAAQKRQRPKRCCGTYIPDCFACPHFRKALFRTDEDESQKGYCEYFEKPLADESRLGNAEVLIEDR